MRSIFALVLVVALTVFAGGARAQGMSVGFAAFGAGVMRGGDVTNVATMLGEMEYDAPYNDSLMGAVVSYAGLSSEGGGPSIGAGYRQFFRVGSRSPDYGRPKYIGLGIGGFGAGNDTPRVDEQTVFAGGEILVRLPVGEGTTYVTGIVGLYKGWVGQTDASIIRAGANVESRIF